MSQIAVDFWYHFGLPVEHINSRSDRRLVGAALAGSWNSDGWPSDNWSRHSMQWVEDDAGCVAFRATVHLQEAAADNWFHWGVTLYFADAHGQEQELWGIVTEVRDPNSVEQLRTFQIHSHGREVHYELALHRYLGANLWRRANGNLDGIRFAVWAPNAQHVDVVFGKVFNHDDASQTPAQGSLPFDKVGGGYIADDGNGMRTDLPVLKMYPSAGGVWTTDPNDPVLPNGGHFLDHVPYMYRVRRSNGDTRMRTDIYSRCQIGSGGIDPAKGSWNGLTSELDGTKGCSVTVNPKTVTTFYKECPPYHPTYTRVWPEREFEPESQFWQNEFSNGGIVRNISDLISYELHPGALGFGSPKPGTLEDVIGLLDHIVSTGFNAVEILPMSEFDGGAENWGYATSHYFAIEYGGGGRDQFKHFVREAHRRGLAVIMDVVYNHFAHDAERAESEYDSVQPEQNMYYWYEGRPSDHPHPNNGYLKNESTARAPRYHEELVRKMFISSAVALVKEFHVDGFRIDQTTSIHEYNRLDMKDGPPVDSANKFGAKLLREFGRTLRLIKPDLILIAEDHSNRQDVTLPTGLGGMGFDARWYADFYHHLIGDTNRGEGCASLIYAAAITMNQGPLRMDYFAGALWASQFQKIVYSESHDEAGNSKGPFFDPNYKDPDKVHTSHRTIVVAANEAPLVGSTRQFAEARSRFAYAITVLSAGSPMSFFGDEVGATKRFKYNAVLQNKEDYHALARGEGRLMLQFFRDINFLRRSSPALRSHNIEILLADNDNRVLVFRRWGNGEEFLVFASLNDAPFDNGFVVRSPSIPDRLWDDCLNSDSHFYGGWNVGNLFPIHSSSGQIDSRIPRCGVVVLKAR